MTKINGLKTRRIQSKKQSHFVIQVLDPANEVVQESNSNTLAIAKSVDLLFVEASSRTFRIPLPSTQTHCSGSRGGLYGPLCVWGDAVLCLKPEKS